MIVEGTVAYARPGALFREVNERILLLQGSGTGPLDFVCECDNPECFATLRMTAAEFREVTARRRTYAIVPAHTLRGHRPVLETAEFAVLTYDPR